MTDTKTKDKPKGTEYVVLQVVNDESGATYRTLGTAKASNDKQAILGILGKTPEAGKYVAIPGRSFNVRQVGAETVTRVTLN
jgi:hypothetical protein